MNEYRIGMKSMKRLREDRELSQEALAVLAKTSQPQIGRLESGTRPMTVRWAQRLAPLLGCKPIDLLPITSDIEDLPQNPDNFKEKITKAGQTLSGIDDNKSHQEGKKVDDRVLRAMGRLMLEVEGMREELQEVKAAVQAQRDPKKAQRK
jgi:transcriptional regulator with XRE-family HTH domain